MGLVGLLNEILILYKSSLNGSNSRNRLGNGAGLLRHWAHGGGEEGKEKVGWIGGKGVDQEGKSKRMLRILNKSV